MPESPTTTTAAKYQNILFDIEGTDCDCDAEPPAAPQCVVTGVDDGAD